MVPVPIHYQLYKLTKPYLIKTLLVPNVVPFAVESQNQLQVLLIYYVLLAPASASPCPISISLHYPLVFQVTHRCHDQHVVIHLVTVDLHFLILHKYLI